MVRESPDNQYERQRAARIAENQRKMQELGLHTAAQALQATAAAARPKPVVQQQRKKKQRFEIEVEVRRSGRLRGSQPESYSEDQLFEKIGIDRVDLIDAPKRRRINIDPARLAELRDREARRAGEEAPRGPFDSGRGVRIQGGRVYDSRYGVTCHWCRQKTLEDHVTCTNADCGGGRKLPVSFCKMCLMNRHGEDIAQAEASGCWVCPPCRGSCGDGCTTCCNCGPCRKKAGLGATHQIIKLARAAGYTNAHDYLVGQRTGEGQGAVEARKEGLAWGAWLKVPYEPAPSEDEDEQQQEEAGESAAEEPAALPAAAAAQLEPSSSQQEAEQAEGAAEAAVAAEKEPSCGRGRGRGRRGAAAKLPEYFAAVKEAEDVASTNPAKAADGEQPTRKQRMMRKLGLARS